MIKESFKNQGTFGKILLLLFVFFTMTIIGMLVTQVFFVSHIGNLNTLKLNQFVLSVLMLLLPPVICGYLWYEKPWQAYSMDKFPPYKAVFGVIVLMIAVSPFINLLAYLNEQIKLPEFLSSIERQMMEMEDKAAEVTKQMLDVHSLSGLIFNLLVLALTPAVAEELFFRGALLNIFSEKRNKHLAIWIVAIVFSLIHFQMYGFIPRMALGALLGYLLVWSRSLWLPIVAHFTNNAMAVVVSYFGRNNDAVGALEELGKAETFGYGIASVVIAILLIWFIYKSLYIKNSELKTQNSAL